MNEQEFTQVIVDRLRTKLVGYEIETRKSLFYSLIIDGQGNIPLRLNSKGEPKRGGGTGFEQDILIYQRVNGQTNIVPRVSIEVKFQAITTHGALVYSEKARRIRSVYPYLRYGLILGDMASIPPRVLRLGAEFDFMLIVSNPPSNDEINSLLEILMDEINTSHQLGKVFTEGSSVTTFRKKIDIEPPIEIIAKDRSMTQDQKYHIRKADESTKVSYYVYENWTAEDKAKIHYGHCSYCNYGKGIHPDASSRNGQWLGPFKSYSVAHEEAIATGRKVSTCKFCNPN